MDYKAFLKYIVDSKTLLAALFATSLILYLGPRHFPTWIPKVPAPWEFTPVAVLALSGVPLFLWLLSRAGLILRALKGWVLRKALSLVELTPAEKKLLMMMSALPGYQVAITQMRSEWRIEIDDCLHGLAKRGLVKRAGFSDELALLTPAGKRRAIDVREAARAAGELLEDPDHYFW